MWNSEIGEWEKKDYEFNNLFVVIDVIRDNYKF